MQAVVILVSLLVITKVTLVYYYYYITRLIRFQSINPFSKLLLTSQTFFSLAGLFRTIYGNSSSKIDLIPVDYVINASMTLGWYVGTRKVDLPEVIHSTSSDVNPCSLQEFNDIMNEKVRVNPSLKMVWMPSAKIRNGIRHNIFFYLFHIFPTMLWYWPEKILGLGLRHHTYVTSNII